MGLGLRVQGLNFLKGGYLGDDIGDYYRHFSGGGLEFGLYLTCRQNEPGHCKAPNLKTLSFRHIYQLSPIFRREGPVFAVSSQKKADEAGSSQPLYCLGFGVSGLRFRV